MASVSFLKKGVFLYKGARKGENVNCEDAHLETMLSLRHLCCWLWGKTIKEERKSEREREREREQTTIVVNYLLKGGSWPSRAAVLCIYYIYFPVILDWWNRNRTVNSARLWYRHREENHISKSYWDMCCESDQTVDIESQMIRNSTSYQTRPLRHINESLILDIWNYNMKKGFKQRKYKYLYIHQHSKVWHQ